MIFSSFSRRARPPISAGPGSANRSGSAERREIPVGLQVALLRVAVTEVAFEIENGVAPRPGPSR